MSNILYYFVAPALFLLLLSGLKYLYREKDLFLKNGLTIDLLLYGSSFVLLAFYFFKIGLIIGIIMSVLGGLAVIKYRLDKEKESRED